MDLTEPEAAEIAAESVATIDIWAGTDAELFDATAPRAPATLRLIEATKHGEVPHSASRGGLGAPTEALNYAGTDYLSLDCPQFA